MCVCGIRPGAGGGGCGPTDSIGVGVGWARNAVCAGPEREPRDPEVHRVRAPGKNPFYNLGVLQSGGDAFHTSVWMPGYSGTAVFRRGMTVFLFFQSFWYVLKLYLCSVFQRLHVLFVGVSR
jgi:hypothetical protein